MAQDGRAITASLLAYTIIGFARLASADSTCLRCGDEAVSPFRQHFRTIRRGSESIGESVPVKDQTGDSELVKHCTDTCLRLAQDRLTGSLLDGNLPKSTSKLSSWLKSFVQDSFTIEEETNSIRRKRQAWGDYVYSYKNRGSRPEYETRVDESVRNDPVTPGRSHTQYSVDKMRALSDNVEKERTKSDGHKERSNCLANQEELLSEVLNLLDEVVERMVEHLDGVVREEVEREISKVAQVKLPIWWIISLQQNNFIFPQQRNANIQLKKSQTISEKRSEEQSLSADSKTRGDTSRASAAAFATSASPGNWYSSSMSDDGNWYPYQTSPSDQLTWYSYANPSPNQWWYASQTSPDGSGVQVAMSNDNGGASEMGSGSSYNPLAAAASISSTHSAAASASSQHASHYPESISAISRQVSATDQHEAAPAAASSYHPEGGGVSSYQPAVSTSTPYASGHQHPSTTTEPPAAGAAASQPSAGASTTSKPPTVIPPVTTSRHPGEISIPPTDGFGPEPDTAASVSVESTESPHAAETTVGLLNTTPRVTEAAETTTVFKTTTPIHVSETTTVPNTTTRKSKTTTASPAPETTTLLQKSTTTRTPTTTTGPLETTSEVPEIDTTHPMIITDEEVPTVPAEGTTRFESTTYFATTPLSAIDGLRTESEELLFRSHNITVPRNARDDPDCDKVSPATRFLPSILEVFKLKAK